MKRNYYKSYGFTLIELLVVIAIIGILSSIVLASLSGARESAQVTRMASDLQQIETAMIMWMQSTGRTEWPDLGATSVKNISSTTNLSKNITSIPKPPIGTTEYRYYRANSTFNCSDGDPVHYGVTLYVDGVEQSIAQKLDSIIDKAGSTDLDCGKFRWRTTADGRIQYSLSTDFTF